MISTPVWLCIAVTAVILLGAWLQSVPCQDKHECIAMKTSVPRDHHAFVALALGLLFLRESVGLTSTLRELHDTKQMWGSHKSCPPVLLLCIILFVLTSVEALFFYKDMPWSHAMPAIGEMTTAWRPIHSFRYFEWLINVPCLIILAGNCALARPVTEVVAPVIITNCYVSWAWAAQVASTPSMRAALILMTFAGYAWASWIMCVQWVRDFLNERPFDGRSQYLRLLVPVGLTVLLIAYAFIYLTGISGLISADTELKAFTLAGFGCKVGFSAVFAYLRWVEDRQTLANLMGKVGTTNTTLLAILKSTFDIVVAGFVKEDGTCTLSDANTADAAELGRVLNRPAAGRALETLISGVEAKQHLSMYIQNVVRQVEESAPTSSPLSNAVLDPSSKTATPISQVLHCALLAGESDSTSLVRAKVHISPVPKSVQHVTDGTEVIVAIAFETIEQNLADQPIDEAVSNLDEAATETMLIAAKAKKLIEEETGKARRRKGIKNQKYGASDQSGQSTMSATGTPTASVTATASGGQEGGDDGSSEFSQASTQIFGGSDVGSQPSKQTYVGSVHMATRQLLGPLLDSKAPGELSSQAMEDHMEVAAQMVRMQGPAAVGHYKYKKEMDEWNESQRNQALINMLEKSRSSGEVDETVWFSEILPRARGPKATRKPREPELPAGQGELWQKAYDMINEQEGEDDEEEEE
mmetsp:Transcript_23912/g.43878  ORF Transcript_23912/g.43878 Transcript_23912/m.43878 type:complete len:698 (+) Transcript_23912:126-2219(+)